MGARSRAWKRAAHFPFDALLSTEGQKSREWEAEVRKERNAMPCRPRNYDLKKESMLLNASPNALGAMTSPPFSFTLS